MPEGSTEKTCSPKKHQGAWIPTCIVLCVLHLPSRREQANTFINTSALDINRALEGRGRKRIQAQSKTWLSECRTKENATKIRRIMYEVSCVFVYTKEDAEKAKCTETPKQYT